MQGILVKLESKNISIPSELASIIAKQKDELARLENFIFDKDCYGLPYSTEECERAEYFKNKMKQNLRSLDEEMRLYLAPIEKRKFDVKTQLLINDCDVKVGYAKDSVGNERIFFGQVVPPSFKTYSTVCIRTCDGSAFPMSFATVPSQYDIDASNCQKFCPNARSELYVFENPGKTLDDAVSLTGKNFKEHPFYFRRFIEFQKNCSCYQMDDQEGSTATVENFDQASGDERKNLLEFLSKKASGSDRLSANIEESSESSGKGNLIGSKPSIEVSDIVISSDSGINMDEDKNRQKQSSTIDKQQQEEQIDIESLPSYQIGKYKVYGPPLFNNDNENLIARMEDKLELLNEKKQRKLKKQLEDEEKVYWFNNKGEYIRPIIRPQTL